MSNDKQPIRRIVKSFAIRLDLLDKLEAEIPRGERSAFVDRLIETALDRHDTRRSSLVGRLAQKGQEQRETDRSASIDQLVKEYDQRTVSPEANTVG